MGEIMGIPEQIALAEEQYGELVLEFGQAMVVLKRLRFRHAQIKKQIQNLQEAVDNEQRKLDEQ
jgi:Skp family chaperone for outer membrane proteins